MRISLVVAPAGAQPSAFVVFRDSLEATIPKVAGLGYDAVELALADASDVRPVEVRRLLDANGLGLSAVSSGRVFAERKAWLTRADEAVRALAVEALKGLVDIAAELGAPRLNVGRVRGPIEDPSAPEASVGRFLAAIRECADHAAAAGVELVIEPVNRYEINFINSVVPDGVEIVRRIDRANVRLMADVFHMNIEDASIAGSLVAAGPAIGYVHFADSNRWAPGRGHTDFPAILRALREIGYDGDIGVEILPYPTADEAAAQAIAFLRPMVAAG